MSNPLNWIAAIGAVAATAGTWLGPLRARWQMHAEQLRTDAARRENELHRARLIEVWHLWHDLPDGPERVKLAQWYTEWTGVAAPFRGGLDSGPQAPGFGCGSEQEVIERYAGFLQALYEPGRMGRPRSALSERDAPPQIE